jgi:alpha-mannosidase
LAVAVRVDPEPIPFAERASRPLQPIHPGQSWGRAFSCAWFHLRGRLPAGAEGRHLVVFADLGGEGLVVDEGGRAIGAVTSRSTWVDRVDAAGGKKVIELGAGMTRGGVVDIWIEAGFNGGRIPPFGRSRFRGAWVAECRDPIKDLYYDYLALVFASAACGDRGRRAVLDAALGAAWLAFRGRRPGAVARARAILAAAAASSGPEGEARAAYGARGQALPSFTAVGHSHLDLAWLWPLRETKRKAARTFAIALGNLASHHGYVYGASQPQQFAWMKAERPELWEGIKAAVREGRMEAQGGMWVEADTNLPSGESLVRQLLYGTRFFREEFGEEVQTCWLPDVFGYDANLPQLLRKSGIEYFMTIKLSWNEVTTFPYRSFTWEGLDGSRVLVHMPPEGEYNSGGTPLCVKRAVERYPERAEAGEGLVVFGAGDGGGGPGEVHVALVARQEALAGFPQLRFGRAVDFFDRLKDKAALLPVWKGELYLEKHQGTYTTQARAKRANRRMEFLLHEAEALAAAAWLRRGAWPGDLLEATWKEALLYQFHDIIPGSSIGRVYAESLARYAILMDGLESAMASAFAALGGGAEGAGGPERPAFANLAPYARSSFVRSGGLWWKVEAGPYSIATAEPAGTSRDLACGEDFIENGNLKVVFARDGSIRSIFDKRRNRETVGAFANRLVLYSDPWRLFNAWDINPACPKLPKRRLCAYRSEAFLDGPRVVMRLRYRHGRTTIVQDVILEEASPLVEFDTACDWHETFRMLRADFAPRTWPDKVRCDIQFGSFERSTRDDSPAERAQFEICAHKWVDLSAGGEGLSLINDCKYGHRVKKGLVSLNLLRSPVYPDPQADRGRQVFRYAWYPHPGDFAEGGTERLACLFNLPLRPAPGGATLPSLASVDKEAVVIDTIKKAEEGEAIVLRLHESSGREVETALSPGFAHGKAREVDLLERPVPIARGGDGGLDLDRLAFGPFEIRTLRVEVRPGAQPS